MNITQEELKELCPRFLLILFLIIVFFRIIFPTKKCKSKVASEYGISKYTLSRWIEFFCPQEIAKKYVGKKIQYVQIFDVYTYLGRPYAFPEYFKCGQLTPIMTKDDLLRAFDISCSKLNRIIKKIENPIDIIGMDMETYKSLKRFPPSKIRKIYNYLLDIKCQGEKPKYQITRQSLDLFAESVDYVEFADIK